MSRCFCFRLLSFLIVPAFCAIGQGQSVPLPIDVLDTPDVAFTSYASNLGSGIGGIADATSLGAGGGSDHFDDAFGISVNGAGYSPLNGAVDGTSLSLDSQPVGGFDVSVNLRSSGPVVRQIVSVTNNGPAGTAAVQWHNNTGNDFSQRTIATSSADLIFDTGDRWLVTADSDTGTDNEVNTWILAGQGGLAPSFVDTVDGSPGFGGAGDQGVTAIYDLFLEQGETQSLLLIVGIEGINQDGIDLAFQLDDPNSAVFQNLVSDLSVSERAQITNFTAAIPEPTSAIVLSLGLVCGVLRRRR